jgi:hypothetical protein
VKDLSEEGKDERPDDVRTRRQDENRIMLFCSPSSNIIVHAAGVIKDAIFLIDRDDGDHHHRHPHGQSKNWCP